MARVNPSQASAVRSIFSIIQRNGFSIMQNYLFPSAAHFASFFPCKTGGESQAPGNAMCWQRLPRKIRKAESACPLLPKNGQVIRWKVLWGRFPKKAGNQKILTPLKTTQREGRSRPSLSPLSQQKFLEKLLEKEPDSSDDSHFQKQFKTEPRPA